jgi:hypothetical protein
MHMNKWKFSKKNAMLNNSFDLVTLKEMFVIRK